MTGRSWIEGIAVVLVASALGIGLWTSAVMATLATVVPLHLDVSWIRLAAWVLASAAALGATGVVTSPGSVTRARRVAVGALGAVALAGLGWTAANAYEADPWFLVTDGAGALGALVVLGWAARPWPLPSLTGRARASVGAFVALAALGWGSGTLLDSVEEQAAQTLPRQDLELAAAYPFSLAPTEPGSMPAVVVDAAGRIGDRVELDGERWNVHRSDALRLRSRDVHRIRWFDAGEVVAISIRVGGELRRALDERARSRASQYDVLYLDGEPLSLVFHAGSEPGRLVLMGTDRAHLHRVYRRLTRPGAT